jgi:sugar phosphate isomerase/epimerase
VFVVASRSSRQRSRCYGSRVSLLLCRQPLTPPPSIVPLSTVSTVHRPTPPSYLQVAQGMGSAYVCGVIYCALQKYPAPPTSLARKNCVSAIREVADVAADRGITLGLEASTSSPAQHHHSALAQRYANPDNAFSIHEG